MDLFRCIMLTLCIPCTLICFDPSLKDQDLDIFVQSLENLQKLRDFELLGRALVAQIKQKERLAFELSQTRAQLWKAENFIAYTQTHLHRFRHTINVLQEKLDTEKNDHQQAVDLVADKMAQVLREKETTISQLQKERIDTLSELARIKEERDAALQKMSALEAQKHEQKKVRPPRLSRAEARRNKKIAMACYTWPEKQKALQNRAAHTTS